MTKKKLRQRILWLLTFILIGAAAYVLGWSDTFHVSTYTVQGVPTQATSVITAQIERSSLVKVGTPIARIDSRVLSRTLSENPWVDKVHITRHWLSGEIEISLSMKTPVAQVAGRENTYLTEDGAITKFPDVIAGDLPSLTGSFVGTSGAKLANELLAQLDGALDAQLHIQSVAVNSPTSLATTVLIVEQPLLIQWGEVKEIPLKIKVLQGLLALPENANIQRVDLSSPLSPIVK